MKWIRISGLLIVVLASMRLGSWIVGWILAKVMPLRTKVVVIIANLLAFGIFAFLLVRDLLPGEPLDLAALFSGLVVFGIYSCTDFYWRPWRRRE
jgi:hypothetical protein